MRERRIGSLVNDDMSWEIKHKGGVSVVVLDSEMGIQNAAEFYQGVLPLATAARAVRLDASESRGVHTSIMQIIYALSQAVADFQVTDASDAFQTIETRMGLSFARSKQNESPASQCGQKQ